MCRECLTGKEFGISMRRMKSIMFRLNLINSKDFQIYSVIWFFNWWLKTWSKKKKISKECATFIDRTYTLYLLMIVTLFSAGILDKIIFLLFIKCIIVFSHTLVSRYGSIRTARNCARYFNGIISNQVFGNKLCFLASRNSF